MNVDYKIICKALASRFNKVLPNLILLQQIAYVEKRFIGESGRLIADIIETTIILNIEGFLVRMNIEEVFDSLDNTFVLAYVFIFAIEVLSFLVRNNKDIKGLNIFDHLLICTVYRDDTLFLENKESIEELVKHYLCFLLFPV